MPYVFALGKPGSVDIDQYGNYTVDFDLGVETDDEVQVLMTVALVENDDTGNDPFNLLFGIRTTALSNGLTSSLDFSHETAKRFVPKEHRQVVMLLILACIRALIGEVKPSEVVMETYEGDLPPPAMAKYMRVSNHMGLLRYLQETHRRDGTDLKDYWFFRKE